ncbi:ATP-binding protein [Fluviispira sanaruensis]|uniref:Histidine kinase/HSP90-like ATPase domain-containing protein n=1 Tax=Fluviispira sanaruensis TaxID=2493639 RepID=A0A4P2VMR2_FLUSA|nr:ATP-binding protein [Fluviispira sanaruensis]BBH54706.1 hypothetical protein JCM31447_31800 [Fluviispira sanaruensis]
MQEKIENINDVIKYSAINSIIKSTLFSIIIFIFMIISMLFLILEKSFEYSIENLENISNLYESSIVVSINNDEYFQKEKFQIEKMQNVIVNVILKENDLNESIKDCISMKFMMLFSNNRYVCFIKKIDYAKNQFFIILKRKIYIDNRFVIKLIFICILSFIVYSLFLIYTFKYNNLRIKIKSGVENFNKCLECLDLNDHKLYEKYSKNVSIIELKNSLDYITKYKIKKEISEEEADKNSIIIHDISKFLGFLPKEIEKLTLNSTLSFVLNIRNLLIENSNSVENYDIRKCVVESAILLSSYGITVNLSKVKSCILNGNYRAMSEVFINIFSNIIEHSELVDVNVQIFTDFHIKSEKLFYICQVENSRSRYHIGNNELIFDKNYTSSDFKLKKNGSGLYFCKKIIESYGGSISCEFKNGMSSKFIVNLEIPITKDLVSGEGSFNIDEKCNEESVVISVIEDDEKIMNKWKEILGTEDVHYYIDPEEFILDYKDGTLTSETNLIVCDYYFDNVPIYKIIDFTFLREILKYKGKIFLHSNAKLNYNNSSYFDYVFESKKVFFSKKELTFILNEINKA